jgi:trehalose 6-phosphate phosphatase
MQAHISSPHWRLATNTLLQPFLKAKRLGFITDMDGTISPIAETPEAAVVTARNRELLGTFVLMLPLVAVVSGRAVRDLQARVAVPGVVYIGNNGLERWVGGGRVLNESVRQHRKALAAALDELRPNLTVGMWIEDKYATASINYRFTPQPETAADLLEPKVREVAERHGLAVKMGKRFFEIRPPLEVNKATVIAQMVEENQLDAVLYIGDDLSDIEALQTVKKLRSNEGFYGVGCGVLHPEPEIAGPIQEAADVLIKDVADVEAFLGWLSENLSKERS